MEERKDLIAERERIEAELAILQKKKEILESKPARKKKPAKKKQEAAKPEKKKPEAKQAKTKPGKPEKKKQEAAKPEKKKPEKKKQEAAEGQKKAEAARPAKKPKAEPGKPAKKKQEAAKPAKKKPEAKQAKTKKEPGKAAKGHVHTVNISEAKQAKTKPGKAAKKKPDAKQAKTKKEPKGAKEEKTLEEEMEEQLSDEEIENFQIEKVDMELLTKKVCDILAEKESSGMFQNDLWKKLKLTPRDGSRLSLKLERMGTITREKLLEDGRWTYRLILKKTPISTQSLENAPCLVCPVEQRCSLEGEISPRSCQLIEDWVIAGIKKPKKK